MTDRPTFITAARRTLTVPRPPDFTVGEPGAVYLERWYVIPRNRWFGIYLHHFLRSDDDRALHDHPKPNLSILLTGSYREHLLGGAVKLRQPWRPWAFWRLIARRAATAHRIELIGGKPVWTLFLTGPIVREWGFLCERGWVPWQKFVSVREGGNAIGEGCGEP